MIKVNVRKAGYTGYDCEIKMQGDLEECADEVMLMLQAITKQVSKNATIKDMNGIPSGIIFMGHVLECLADYLGKEIEKYEKR